MDDDRRASDSASLRITSPIAAMAGIGPKRAAALASRGIETAGDLIFHLPSRYQDWRERTPPNDLRPGTIAVIEGDLGKILEGRMRAARWRRFATGWLKAGGRRIRLVWFNLPAYMRGYLPAGQRVLIRGRVTGAADGGLEIAQPEIHQLSEGAPPRIRPVYRLPTFVGQRLFANLVTRTLSQGFVRGAIPDEVRGEIPSVQDALAYLHDPPADADVRALEAGESPGHIALAFDELFAFELALLIERARSARRTGIALDGREDLSTRLIRELPFELTNAQAGAIDEIRADLARHGQMNRMLMGDVGSGKTLVAFWAMLRAVECGHQAAMMAPTELLAEQHYRSFQRLCGKLNIRSALLTGRIGAVDRKPILRDLSSGDLPIVFGTHALIQERVRIRDLALGVIDEQHRFGVFDRAKMKALGARVNLLMMTATPIPRSLAMSLFANLDVSFLDEMPPGRTPISTEIYSEDDLARTHDLLHAEIQNGGRAYYVVPFIDGEDDEAKSVSATAARIAKSVLRDARIGTMHGRMAGAQKDRVMRAFRDGALDILVCTTVVEVGIDVPEATVIVIDAAERYGLAQLHQLRGRVGRGDQPSRCCLIASRDCDSDSLERLNVMRQCTTGKSVAEADLQLRGPGDLLGARQTGALPLRFIHLVRDLHTVERARRMAEDWLKRDPNLESAASEGARDALRKMLSLGFSLGDVG
ncbi:MAG: ATP-dependent DNA helicase RecG [Candidatus Binatus sp.]|uniref:ATP-dependent DNA helicase RecG n=1 Tax=Candidatus Binatus sp. TaxID=2811406 RepID=UPI00271C0E2C|nr:ATP-dependent DNA helicase RecG [Candidatus Binatus sp.]MDO8431050.1 ATP-dependent DNA helicase RecG [Candidatus Binatus sp.]